MTTLAPARSILSITRAIPIPKNPEGDDRPINAQ